MKIEEIWKDVIGYEGLYQVSNLGRVKSLNYGRTSKERILKPILKKEYYNVSLKRKYYRIHRLVVQAFIGEIPEGYCVNHINEVKTDNRVENLEIVTPAENTRFSCCGRIPWNKGKKGLQRMSNEQRLRISNSLKGKKFSEEHKRKISEARKRYFQRRREV